MPVHTDCEAHSCRCFSCTRRTLNVPVISPAHENACALHSSLRFDSLFASSFFFHSVSSVPSAVRCTRHYSNWMQLATFRLFRALSSTANHLCLGNASEWRVIFSLLLAFLLFRASPVCRVARACLRARSLSKKSLCFSLHGVIYVHAGVRLRSVLGTIVRFVQYLCAAMASSRRTLGSGDRSFHAQHTGRSCEAERGCTLRSLDSFHRSKILRLARTAPIAAAATAAEQVSTLHNATAYVEGIHFGSCFRQVNTHAPYTFQSFKIHQKKREKSLRSKYTSFFFRFSFRFSFSSFTSSSTSSSSFNRTCSAAITNRNQLHSGPATIRSSLRERKNKIEKNKLRKFRQVRVKPKEHWKKFQSFCCACASELKLKFQVKNRSSVQK